ncbi:Meckelin [Intoshia linei]|uniref:Meckelin n=1 Tax=Intoshia linei TaxID=1819745 RepID=A0A177B9Z9_9BILA|nr:Meckelin [Intoshia linei]
MLNKLNEKVDEPELNVCKLLEFVEFDEIMNYINELLQHGTLEEFKKDKFKSIFDRYLENGNLFTKHMKKMTEPLLKLIKTSKNESTFFTSCELIYYIFKVKGIKNISIYMPNGVDDLIFVVSKLEKIDKVDEETWFSIYILLIWLSIVCLIPFDMKIFETNQDKLANRILDISKKFSTYYGTNQEGGALVIGKFLARPDMKDALQVFVENVTENLVSQTLKSNNEIEGNVLVLCRIFKNNCNEMHKKLSIQLINEIPNLDHLFDSKQDKIRHFSIKMVQHAILSLLPIKMSSWLYTRKIKNTMGVAYQTEGADNKMTTQVLNCIQLGIGPIFFKLGDKNCKVRWSAAKGICRIVCRVSLDVAQTLIDELCSIFTVKNTTCELVHGMCLVFAELGRNGALLPKNMQTVFPQILMALQFEQPFIFGPTGEFVRDAACFTLWSFSRTFTIQEIEHLLLNVAQHLILTFLFDRSVTVRRAASAAFQEFYGRFSKIPHGFDIMIKCDFSQVGILKNCFSNLAQFVCNYDVYRNIMFHHLLENRMVHWDRQISSLSVTCLQLYVLPYIDEGYITNYLYPTLLKYLASSDDDKVYGALFFLSDSKNLFYIKDSKKQKKNETFLANLVKSRDIMGGLEMFPKMSTSIKGIFMKFAAATFVKCHEMNCNTLIKQKNHYFVKKFLYCKNVEPFISELSESIGKILISSENDISREFYLEMYKKIPFKKRTDLVGYDEILICISSIKFVYRPASKQSFMNQSKNQEFIQNVISRLINCLSMEKYLNYETRKIYKFKLLAIETLETYLNIEQLSSKWVRNIVKAFIYCLNVERFDNFGDVGCEIRLKVLILFKKYFKSQDKQYQFIRNRIIQFLIYGDCDKFNDGQKDDGKNLPFSQKYVSLALCINRLVRISLEGIQNLCIQASACLFYVVKFICQSHNINEINVLNIQFKKFIDNGQHSINNIKVVVTCLQYDWLTYEGILGISKSIGGLTKSTRIIAGLYTFTLLRDSKRIMALDIFADQILDLKKSKPDSFFNIFKTFEILLTDALSIYRVKKFLNHILNTLHEFTNFIVLPLNEKWYKTATDIFNLIETHTKLTKIFKDINSCTKLYCAFLEYSDVLYKRGIEMLLILLKSEYPKIRLNTAIEFQENLTVFDDFFQKKLEPNKFNEISTILVETQWCEDEDYQLKIIELKKLFNCIFLLILKLVIVKSVSYEYLKSSLADCKSSRADEFQEYFDTITLQCTQCPQDSKKNVVSSDGYSCVCTPKYRRVNKDGNVICEKCPNDLVADEDNGMICVECSKSSPYNNITQSCEKCSIDSVSAVLNVDGSPIVDKDEAIVPTVPLENMESTQNVTNPVTTSPTNIKAKNIAMYSKHCLPCNKMTIPDEDKQRCTVCTKNTIYLKSFSSCICPVERQSGSFCFESKDYLPGNSLNLYKTTYGNLNIDSAYFKDNIRTNYGLCMPSINNQTACQILSNMCVLIMYSRTNELTAVNTDACGLYFRQLNLDRFSKIITVPTTKNNTTPTDNTKTATSRLQQRDRPIDLPWLYYLEETGNIILSHNVLEKIYALPASNLEIEFSKYSLDGKFLGMFSSVGGEIQLCKEGVLRLDSAWKIGVEYKQACTIRAKDLWNTEKYPTNLYDPFLSSIVEGETVLYPIPVLITNYMDKNKNKVNVGSNAKDWPSDKWQFTRRFFLVDNIGGIAVKGSSKIQDALIDKETEDTEIAKAVRYAKSIVFYITLKEAFTTNTIGIDSGSTDGQIMPPFMVIDYDVVTLDEITNNPNAHISTTFEVKYRMSTITFQSNFNWSIQGLSIVAVIIAAIRTASWNRRNGNLTIEVLTVIKFFLHLFASISDVFLITIIGATFWIAIFFKLQKTAVVMLPSVESQKSWLEPYIITAVVFRIISTIHLIGRQISVDIFLIDWERSHGNSDQKNTSDVSAWRTYFVANEWNEIQTYRKCPHAIRLFFIMFLLYVTNFDTFAAWQATGGEILDTVWLKTVVPGRDVDALGADYRCVDNQVLRIALISAIFFGIYIVQWIIDSAIYTRFIEDKIEQFVDLCSMCSISVVIFETKNYGYYIHGRSIHGYADTGMKQMYENMDREEKDLCGKRGLQPNSDQQTFSMLLAQNIRTHYDNIIYPILSGNDLTITIPTKDEKTNLNRLDAAIVKCLNSYSFLNKLLQSFFEHSLKEVDYEVKDRTLIELLLNLESYGIQNDISVLYKDNGHSFDSVLFYGNEWYLLSFELLIFLIIDYYSQNYILA